MTELMLSKSSFVTEGTFLATPLCFPDVSTPIKPDESYLTCLRISPHTQVIYGATSGKQAHFIGAALRSDHGYVVELGAIEGMTDAIALGADSQNLYGCFNGNGSALIAGINLMTGYSIGTSNGIQEWSFLRQSVNVFCELPGETIVDSVYSDVSGEFIILTDKRLLVCALPTGEIKELHTNKRFTHIFSDNNGMHLLLSDDNLIYRLTSEQELIASIKRVPSETEIDQICLINNKLALIATVHGALYRLNLTTLAVTPFSSVPIAPIKTMAPVAGKYCYLFYGEGIGRFGRINLADGGFRDLGCVVSALSVKRYCYNLSCSLVGPDGEIYFGENDRGGHLWIYYPPINLFLE